MLGVRLRVIRPGVVRRLLGMRLRVIRPGVVRRLLVCRRLGGKRVFIQHARPKISIIHLSFRPRSIEARLVGFRIELFRLEPGRRDVHTVGDGLLDLGKLLGHDLVVSFNRSLDEERVHGVALVELLAKRVAHVAFERAVAVRVVPAERLGDEPAAVIVGARGVHGVPAQDVRQRACRLVVLVRQAHPVERVDAVERDVHSLGVDPLRVLALVHALLKPPPDVVDKLFRLEVVIAVVAAVHLAHRLRELRLIPEIRQGLLSHRGTELMIVECAPPEVLAIVVIHEQFRTPRRLLELHGIPKHAQRDERSLRRARSGHVRADDGLQRLTLVGGDEPAPSPGFFAGILEGFWEGGEGGCVVDEDGGEEHGGSGAEEVGLAELGVEDVVLRA